MVELNDREAQIVLQLIRIAWKSGTVDEEQKGIDLMNLKAKLMDSSYKPEKEEAVEVR